MSWDTRVAQEAIIVYFVRCSTCGLNKQCADEYEAERERSAHWRAHDERYAANEMDLGYDLNPDPLTRRDPPWEVIERQQEAEQRRWDEYWESLDDEGRARERQMMDDHVTQSRDD